MSFWAWLHDVADPARWPRLHRLAWRFAGSGGPCPHDRALAGGLR